MKSDLEVNYDKLAELLEEQIAGKTDAIIICGTSRRICNNVRRGHSKVIRFAIERVNHRIPVIAGTGSNSTRTAIQLSQEAAKDGADGLLLVTPYYNKATQNGLIAHYTQICNSVDIPAILYNVPSRTGCAIQPTTVAHLVKNVDNIVGIKEASGDISVGAKIMHLCDGNIDLYSGNDDQVVPLLSLGRNRCYLRTFQRSSDLRSRHGNKISFRRYGRKLQNAVRRASDLRRSFLRSQSDPCKSRYEHDGQRSRFS